MTDSDRRKLLWLLLGDAYPQFCLGSQGFGTSQPLLFFQTPHGPRSRSESEAEAYFAELKALSDAELVSRYGELRARLSAKQEAKHPLNRGDAIATDEIYSHYCKAAYWTAQEAAALFVQRNPERLTKTLVEYDR